MLQLLVRGHTHIKHFARTFPSTFSMSRLRMRLFLSIICIGECFAQWVDNPSCSFHGPNGYTLSWSADPSGIIYFNYSQNNFPTNGNHWTGVSFGTASDSRGDAIIFETQNGQLTVSSGTAEASGTCNTCPQQGSVLQKSARNIISTSYATISSGNARAEFSRPLFSNGITLSSCNFWIFYAQPTRAIENANSFTASATPIPRQICDIINTCPLNASYEWSSTPLPLTTEYSSTYSTTTSFDRLQYDEPFPSPATAHSDYSNSATYASNINYVPNSNYQFLNTSLRQQYLGNNGVYSTPLYDESDQESTPILTNAEQNQANYQRILRDYQVNPNPTANMTFTSNIYGYNYNTASTSSSSSTGSSYSSASSSPLSTGTSYSSSPYNSVYSNPTYSSGIASAPSSSSSIFRPQYYYYSSVYPSYLVPGPYYYHAREIGTYYSPSSTSSSSASSSSSSTQARSSTDSSHNTLGVRPLTGVYRDTPSSSAMSSSSSTSQAYYEPSASASASFTPYFYSPFVQSYGSRQYDTSSPTGIAYGPNSISYEMLQPHSATYYQATLGNK